MSADESRPDDGGPTDDELVGADPHLRTPGDGLDYQPGSLTAEAPPSGDSERSGRSDEAPHQEAAPQHEAESPEQAERRETDPSCFSPPEGGGSLSGEERTADFTERISKPDEPRHRTMIEAFRYGWGNGERKLMIAGAITSVIFSFLAFLLGVNFFAKVTSTSSHPYDVEIPVRVMDRVPGVDGPATNSDRVTVSIEGCNTTDDVLLLSFSGQWVKYDDPSQRGPNYLVPAQLVSGVAVPPGGVLCGDGSLPTITQLPLPDEVINDPGIWQISVQVEVRECPDPLISSQIGSQALSCERPGSVLDHVGWFTQTFEVVSDAATGGEAPREAD